MRKQLFTPKIFLKASEGSLSQPVGNESLFGVD
jgi:hypothetical protein